jgi:hypothetical protein
MKTYGVKVIPTKDGLRVEQLEQQSPGGRFKTNGRSLFVDRETNKKNYRDSLMSAIDLGLAGEINETHLVKEK